MTKDEKLYPLILFDEKLQELLDSGFIKNWKDKEIKYKIDLKDGKSNITNNYPSGDEIKSFLLTLRFFIQDNEACSIRNLNKHYKKIDVSNNLVEKFQQTREKLNEFLHAPTGFTEDGKNYTYWEIFEIYTYGKYAHSNKRKEVKNWLENDLFTSLTKFYFLSVLYDITKILVIIAKINEKTIEELE